MSLREAVTTALVGWPSPTDGPNGAVVPTHCIYPSNGLVRVYVTGGDREFKVTDGAGALDELDSSGGYTYDDLHILRAVARAHGLDVNSSGVIFSPIVTMDQLAGTIALVANASKEAAHGLIERFRSVPKKNFREMLARMITIEQTQGMFLEVSLKRAIVGASTKAHRFDYDLVLKGHKRLLLDTVMPEASSINSVLAANLDVKEAELPDTLQRIVYDDADEWKPSDLALLGLGAVVVPFTKLRPVLGRLAA